MSSDALAGDRRRQPSSSTRAGQLGGLGREHDQRVADTGERRNALDQLDPAQVVAAQDVALARAPALGGEQVSLGHVATSTMFVSAVHDRGEPAAQVVADHAALEVSPGWLRSTAGAEDVGGVDDDDLDAQPRARRERLGLALVLRVRVGEPEPAPAIDVVLVPGAVAAGAGPMPATLEVSTTRRTPSAAAASTTSRGASAFTCQTRSAGREPT